MYLCVQLHLHQETSLFFFLAPPLFFFFLAVVARMRAAGTGLRPRNVEITMGKWSQWAPAQHAPDALPSSLRHSGRRRYLGT